MYTATDAKRQVVSKLCAPRLTRDFTLRASLCPTGRSRVTPHLPTPETWLESGRWIVAFVAVHRKLKRGIPTVATHSNSDSQRQSDFASTYYPSTLSLALDVPPHALISTSLPVSARLVRGVGVCALRRNMLPRPSGTQHCGCLATKVHSEQVFRQSLLRPHPRAHGSLRVGQDRAQLTHSSDPLCPPAILHCSSHARARTGCFKARGLGRAIKRMQIATFPLGGRRTGRHPAPSREPTEPTNKRPRDRSDFNNGGAGREKEEKAGWHSKRMRIRVPRLRASYMPARLNVRPRHFFFFFFLGTTLE